MSWACAMVIPPGRASSRPDVVCICRTNGIICSSASAGGMTMAQAQDIVLDYVRYWVPEAGKAPLAGNSVGTDKAFLERDMADLVGHLHYRIVDVSSFKEVARRWY